MPCGGTKHLELGGHPWGPCLSVLLFSWGSHRVQSWGAGECISSYATCVGSPGTEARNF